MMHVQYGFKSFAGKAKYFTFHYVELIYECGCVVRIGPYGRQDAPRLCEQHFRPIKTRVDTYSRNKIEWV